MNLKLTQRDKRLLMLVCCAAIAVLCWQFLISPAIKMKQDLHLEIEQLHLELKEQEQEINALEPRREAAGKREAQLSAASRTCYAPLETREMDNIITGMLLDNQLFPESLTLTESQPGLPEPYLFAPEADEGAQQDANAQTAAEAQDYVFIGTAELAARGSEEHWRAFLDDAAQQPGLRVVRFNLEQQTYATSDRETVTDHKISCTLEFYMCEHGEETQS